MAITIFHNPSCSKSRAAVDALKRKGEVTHIREYLIATPTLEELKTLQKLLNLPARAMLREGELVFKNRFSHIDLNDDEAVLKAITEEPRLLERPILIRGEKAVIGRPTENIEKLFSQ
ncbi:MAG: arsenate reductase [Proteobacteria bacterium]|nr:MAG: arsenate reductase [Pseudomonadota bacterium]